MSNHLIVVVGLIVVGTLMLLAMVARMYQKAGPNEAIIRYGFGGPKVIIGHGALVYPVVQHTRSLSLELMSFDVAPSQDLYTKQGVAVTVEAVAQIKVRSDMESIMTAAEQFLSKSPAERPPRLSREAPRRRISIPPSARPLWSPSTDRPQARSGIRPTGSTSRDS